MTLTTGAAPLFALAQAAEPFLPRNLEGWLRVATTIAGAILGTWGILRSELKRTMEAERQVTVNALALLRQEWFDAMEKEQNARESADGRGEERVQDIAQKVHIWMGRLDLLTERLHEDRLAQSKEIAALRLEMANGFTTMRDMLHNCPYREDHPGRES